MSSRPILALGVGCGVTAAIGLVPGVLWADGLVAVLTGIAGLAAAIVGLRGHRTAGAGWRLVLAFLALHLAGNVVVWASRLAGEPVAALPISDGLSLAAAASLAAGLYQLSCAREDRALLRLDVGAIAVAGAVLVAGLLAGRYFAGPLTDARAFSQLAFAVADVAIVAVWLRMLLAPRPAPRHVDLLLLGTGCLLVSDLLRNVQALSGPVERGSWIEIGWNLAPLILGAALLHPSVSAAEDGDRDFELHLGSVWLLGIVSLAGPLLMSLDETTSFAGLDYAGIPQLVVAGTVVIGGFVVFRTTLLLRRSLALQDALRAALAISDESLIAAERHYGTVIENIPAVTFELQIDVGGAVSSYVSPQLEELLGYTAEQWMADPGLYARSLHPDDRAAVLADQARFASAGHRPEARELRLLRADGSAVWVRQDFAVHHDGGRAVLLGFLMDISDRKQIQAERDQMELELRLAQRLEAVGQLAAGVAHEVNTPIQYVGDAIRFVDDAYRDIEPLLDVYDELRDATAASAPPELRARVDEAEELADLAYIRERVPAALERALAGVDRVATIVRAMREFAHPPTLDHRPCDLNTLIANTLTVASNEYKYVADVEQSLAELPHVIGNAGDLGQVLLNLIVNAAHAIQDAHDDTETRGTIRISTHIDGEHAVVSIADNGGGIPTELANRVFDPFFTTKEVGRGTGQGLAIARTIVVDRHGGALTYDTWPGEGTTFHIRLPLASAPTASDAPLATLGTRH